LVGRVIARKSIDGEDDVMPAGGGFPLVGGGLALTSTTLPASVLYAKLSASVGVGPADDAAIALCLM
jgi:hypothetical protein